jgi:hypothetical protein
VSDTVSIPKLASALSVEKALLLSVTLLSKLVCIFEAVRCKESQCRGLGSNATAQYCRRLSICSHGGHK